MQTILKGGIGTIRVAINGEDGANYEGVLHVLFCGIEKSVLNPQAGETYTLDFSADETRSMPLGSWDVKIVFENEQGKRTLSNVATKVFVTDDAECVYTDSPFAVAPGVGAQVDEIGDEYTMNDLKNALNKIIKLTHVIVLFALPCFGEIVQTAPLQYVKNWMPVVTNIDESAFDVSPQITAATNALMNRIDLDNVMRQRNVYPDRYVTNSISFGDCGIYLESLYPNQGLESVLMYPNFLEITSLAPNFDYENSSWIVLTGEKMIHNNGVPEGYEILYPTNNGRLVVDTELVAATNAIDVTSQLAPMQSSLAQISQTVDGFVTYVTGEDSYLSVTNYDSQIHTPSMKLVQKMPADSNHAEPWERVVWDELTRWNNFMLGEWKTLNEETIPATRQWGFYDSKTGHIQPDEDVLNVSQSKVVLSPGMEWQKTITTGGCAVWILTYNEPIDFVPTENGFFRITDADGNVLQEIIKGDKRVVGATAFSATMVNGNFEVEYRVATDAHPEVYVCNDLRNAVWTKVTESDIVDGSSWLSNTSGNYRIAITPKTGQSKMFVRATYEVGGNTYIRNNVAHSSDKIVIGGVEYNVTVETISGKKVPVLTEAH